MSCTSPNAQRLPPYPQTLEFVPPLRRLPSRTWNTTIPEAFLHPLAQPPSGFRRFRSSAAVPSQNGAECRVSGGGLLDLLGVFDTQAAFAA